jgi:signal transduction histidine kinase
MGSSTEKILSYALGGIIGAIAGYILIASHMEMNLQSESEALILVVITTVIGLLFSFAIVEYRHAKELKKNTLIRDETVALITHEMRTGLTSTGWAIDLVLKKYKQNMSEGDVQLLQDIVTSIHTTVMHSVNLLDVSLLDIKKLAIALTWTKLEKVAEMFKEVLEKYAIGAEHKGIELIRSIALDHERMAEVDMMRLRIILENLLENAIQYTLGDGGRKKTITVMIKNNEKDMEISVADTGIGIPVSEQQKIFGEFFRASNARSKLSAGSGIGLYTCAQYVKAHRGTIRFESKEGEGTTFFVTIPLKTAIDVEDFAKKI